MPRRVGAYLRDGLEDLANALPDHRRRARRRTVRRRRAGARPCHARACHARRRRASSTGCARGDVLISAAGRAANVLKIRPPLVFSKDNADLFLTTLDEVLAEISGE